MLRALSTVAASGTRGTCFFTVELVVASKVGCSRRRRERRFRAYSAIHADPRGAWTLRLRGAGAGLSSVRTRTARHDPAARAAVQPAHARPARAGAGRARQPRRDARPARPRQLVAAARYVALRHGFLRAAGRR